MAKRQIALFVETCFPTPAYAKYYPNVTKKIQLDTSCFQGILGGFGSNDKDIYDGPHSITVGEVSALWLKHLTGREFKDLAVFDAWFTANREYLKWNQEAGKFEIRRPQTFPAIGGN
ncbi:MAG: hypothetical protein QGG42_02770 [Phycisphaerae bacterium]|nr:hypothetical protein [Phycisphaerae bacterium]